MSITEKILNGIKQAITEGGKVNIDLREASAITGYNVAATLKKIISSSVISIQKKLL